MAKTLLTKHFLSKYADFPEHMNELGRFVFYRTYSRWLPEEKRRETWKETATRSTEYNLSLDPRYKDALEGNDKDALRELRREAKAYFHSMYNLKQFLSGRTLWVGGTEVAEKFPMANFNCSFLVIDSFKDFEDLFYALMIGTGVGLRILKSDVEQLAPIRTDEVKLIHRKFTPVEREFRQDITSVIFEDNRAAIYVGDSKEGWATSLTRYFEIMTEPWYRGIDEIEIVYNNVRPKGERLKTFGGTASGHESIKTMFEKIHKAITTDAYAPRPVNGRLRPIHALDIANIIGENVVIGGVRRTAEIALGSADDEEFKNAKSNLTPDKYHRFLSNNSVFFEDTPTRDEVTEMFDILRDNGEPAFFNSVAASKRRPNFKGTNPCVEILLDDKGLCNLTTMNVLAFVKDGELDLEGILEAQRMSARAGYRMTCVDLELPEWDRIQKRDRLTGVSMTGWKDAMEALDYSVEQENELKRILGNVAREASDEYADKLGLNRSLLVTAVKPEGTISQLAGGVSSGLHHTHSPYYIRRIRISANDALLKTVEALGWSVKNEVGHGELQEDGTIKPVSTKVVEFPIATPVKRTKYEVSALEQLQTYFDFQEHYTEHNSSNTITVKEHEWDEVEEYIYDRWDDMLAVSFLKLDDHSYDLAPYEAITEEEYNERKAKMYTFESYMLQAFEQEETEIDLGDETCEGGACPIR
jgi:ribonucleoside-diphosphate reductase alpha chain/ribonucleoside-triphosphate reductase